MTCYINQLSNNQIMVIVYACVFFRCSAVNQLTGGTCSVRPKMDRCRATIIQKGNNFLPGHQFHNHPAKPGSHIAAVITRDVSLLTDL